MEQARRYEPLNIRARAIRALIDRALLKVEKDYGLGGHTPKPYHSPERTIWVLSAAEQLADAAIINGKITKWEKELLKIAAAYNNVVHDSNDPESEERSAEIAARHMNMLGLFGPQDIDRTGRIILATKVKDQTEGHIQQSASKDDYLTMLMADADLFSLGAQPEVYWDMAKRLFAETHPDQELAGESLRQFVHEQQNLISGHRYYTQEARQLFNHQPEILELLQSKLSA